ncbi:MAG TPA: hypothetical protein PLO67_15780 [Saprospiraceae bacterium]|nr:hypothetical protein [Saprospiraceae bacterium]HPI07780.1 hypothetical protein [Saprospiraceae bacterium]
MNFPNLQSITHGNRQVLEEILSIFLQQAVVEMAELNQALASGDYTRMSDTVHSMRTSIAYICDDGTFPERLLELEFQAKNNQEGWKVLGEGALKEYEGLVRRVKEEMGGAM